MIEKEPQLASLMIWESLGTLLITISIGVIGDPDLRGLRTGLPQISTFAI
jgi:hypothetical protein